VSFEFAVIEMPFNRRFAAREVVGETDKTLVVKCLSDGSVHRIAKASWLVRRGFSTFQEAEAEASRVTQKMLGARAHFDQQVAQITKEFSRG